MKKEIKLLEETIEYHNQQFINGTPEISDIDYDNLIEALKKLDPNNELIINYLEEIPNSDKKKKIKKSVTMISLDKAYDINNVLLWAKKYARSESELFIIEPKYDGISANFEHEKLLLYTRARAKEDVGIDLSDKISIIVCITKDNEGTPIVIHLPDVQKDVRGEILIRDDVFENNRSLFVRGNGDKYKTSRSAVGGILGKDTVDSKFLGYIHFVDFNTYSIETNLVNMSDAIEYAKNQFKSLGFPMDGIVIKLKDKEYKESLGNTSHHPRGELALKPKNPTGETTIIDIELSIGKSAITPVGIVEPVEIAGNINKRVNLHNWKFVMDNDIRIGDKIILQKAGEIIPQYHSLISRGKNSKKIVPPTHCPSCESILTWDGPNLRCLNDVCGSTLQKRLTDSIKKIGIENIGPSTVSKLITDLGCSNLVDVFNLTYSDIIKLDKFGDVSSKNFILEVDKVKNNPVPNWRVLASFNIDGVGRSLSKDILKSVSFDLLRRISEERLMEIPNIGIERARDIFDYLHDNKTYIDALLKIIKIDDNVQKIDTNKESINICFTGKDPYDRGRDWYFNYIENKGHVADKSITKKTQLLVTDNPNKKSNKMMKAEKNGTKIITYEQFEEIMNQL
jgi:DNA ligase (NAD+)